jgi:hypothetical protein
MISDLITLCTSSEFLLISLVASNATIAFSYFAIPVAMAVVLKDRRRDIPYPWLWALFVAFIVACGLTHVVHVVSLLTGVDYLGVHAVFQIVTAVASVLTAIALIAILPQIKLLPSPAQQRQALETTINERTKQKDLLIREINHRVGNQLQILTSLLNIEERKADTEDVRSLIERLRIHLDQMSSEHARLSKQNYLAELLERESAASTGGSLQRE